MFSYLCCFNLNGSLHFSTFVALLCVFVTNTLAGVLQNFIMCYPSNSGVDTRGFSGYLEPFHEQKGPFSKVSVRV